MQLPPAIHPDDFAFLCELLKKQIGFSLSSDKEYLLHSRLEPVITANKFADIAALVASIRRYRSIDLIKAVCEAMTINETSFFRDGKPFEDIRTRILPLLYQQAQQRQQLRFWSAAASTGQEAYSLAMILREAQNHHTGWTYEILATDVSSKSLEKATQGIYSEFEVQRGITPNVALHYFKRTSSGGWQASDDLKAMISFKTHNLLDDFLTPGAFDLILCRNVLIYFDAETKRRVLRLLCRHLTPGGVLMLGATETLDIADVGVPLVELWHSTYQMPAQSLVSRHQVSS